MSDARTKPLARSGSGLGLNYLSAGPPPSGAALEGGKAQVPRRAPGSGHLGVGRCCWFRTPCCGKGQGGLSVCAAEAPSVSGQMRASLLFMAGSLGRKMLKLLTQK